MKKADQVQDKIYTTRGLLQKIQQLRVVERRIAFTNGVFDVLHRGHIHSLSEAAKTADFLVVGINTDASVKRIKGNDRPLYDEETRALVLASLMIIDAVVLFVEDSPLELIKAIRPDVLVKGGDYTVDQIVGAKEVMSYGGKVVINPLLEGFSTTGLINQLQKK